jgi:hypothetical protein
MNNSMRGQFYLRVKSVDKICGQKCEDGTCGQESVDKICKQKSVGTICKQDLGSEICTASITSITTLGVSALALQEQLVNSYSPLLRNF